MGMGFFLNYKIFFRYTVVLVPQVYECIEKSPDCTFLKGIYELHLNKATVIKKFQNSWSHAMWNDLFI